MKKKIKLLSTKDIQSYSIKQDMDRYLIHCKARGLSPHTLTSYEVALNGFISWTGDIPTSSITTEVIEKFILHCRDEGKNNNTSIHDKLKTLRTFFKYCELDITLPNIKPEKNFKAPYTQEESLSSVEYFLYLRVRKASGPIDSYFIIHL